MHKTPLVFVRIFFFIGSSNISSVNFCAEEFSKTGRAKFLKLGTMIDPDKNWTGVTFEAN